MNVSLFGDAVPCGYCIEAVYIPASYIQCQTTEGYLSFLPGGDAQAFLDWYKTCEERQGILYINQSRAGVWARTLIDGTALCFWHIPHALEAKRRNQRR